MPSQESQPNLALERLENFEAQKAQTEYWNGLVGEAGVTDFSEDAKKRLEEAAAYDKHLAALEDVDSRDSLTRTFDKAESGEHKDYIDRAIEGDPKLRFMNNLAKDVAELRALKLTGEESEDPDRLIQRLEDKESALQERLIDFDETSSLTSGEKEDIINRVIDRTEGVAEVTSEVDEDPTAYGHDHEHHSHADEHHHHETGEPEAQAPEPDAATQPESVKDRTDYIKDLDDEVNSLAERLAEIEEDGLNGEFESLFAQFYDKLTELQRISKSRFTPAYLADHQRVLLERARIPKEAYDDLVSTFIEQESEESAEVQDDDEVVDDQEFGSDDEFFGSDEEQEEPEKKRAYQRFTGGVKKAGLKLGMLTAAAVRLPARGNEWVNHKMPEEWSPRRKRIVKAAAGLAIVGVGAGVAYKLGVFDQAGEGSEVMSGNEINSETANDSSDLPEAEAPAMDTQSGLEGLDDELIGGAEGADGDVEAVGDAGAAMDTQSGLEGLDDELIGGAEGADGDVEAVGETAADQEVAETSIDTETLAVNEGKGFINTFQEQYGLTASEAEQAYETVKQHLVNAEGTYTQGGDIRISSPGSFTMPEAAQSALEDYLRSIDKL